MNKCPEHRLVEIAEGFKYKERECTKIFGIVTKKTTEKSLVGMHYMCKCCGMTKYVDLVAQREEAKEFNKLLKDVKK